MQPYLTPTGGVCPVLSYLDPTDDGFYNDQEAEGNLGFQEENQ